MARRRGTFITFEGTEGAGKSTLIQEILTRLRLTGVPCIRTREPGGTPVAEKIRPILLEESMHPWTEAFLYQAARSEHVERIILPALAEGKVVLCDRFTDSTLAYQGHARGLNLRELEKLNHLATRGLKPDWSIFVDLPPAEGLKRATEITRFEKEGEGFQKKVRQGFLKVIRKSPKRWTVLNSHKYLPEQLADQFMLVFNKRSSLLRLKRRTP